MSRPALELLDEFEDEIYIRKRIPVQMEEGRWFDAFAYIIDPKDRAILSMNPWIREKFVEDHLASYIEACRKFRRTAIRFLSIKSPIN